jgi:hypothetical protein
LFTASAVLLNYVTSQKQNDCAKILEQDGAALQFHAGVCAYFDESFPVEWLARAGRIACPPHFPDDIFSSSV